MSKRDQVAKSEFSDEDYSQHYQLKKAGMEKVLGPMHDMVGHAIVPFQVGGPVDMYRFDSIRPLVVLRKISGGSRSENGSRTRMVLASLFGTWAARQLNPFLTCLANLQAPLHAASP